MFVRILVPVELELLVLPSSLTRRWGSDLVFCESSTHSELLRSLSSPRLIVLIPGIHV